MRVSLVEAGDKTTNSMLITIQVTLSDFNEASEGKFNDTSGVWTPGLDSSAGLKITRCDLATLEPSCEFNAPSPAC